MYKILAFILTFSYVLSMQAQDFAFKCFEKINSVNTKNAVFSPICAQFTLSMLADGATSNTQQQLLEALGYTTDTEARNACSAIITALPNLDQSVAFELANSMWVNLNATTKEEYQQMLKTHYCADVFNSDISSAEGLKSIDAWVSDKSHGNIPGLGLLPSPTRIMTLINTVYFKAPFTFPFMKEYTKNVTFTNADGTKVTVPMMNTCENFKYAHMEDLGYDVVEIPLGLYDDEQAWDNNSQYTLVLFNPLNPEVQLCKELWQAYPRHLMIKDPVDLALPKFSITQSIDLKPVLQGMGVSSLFCDPDLSKISDGNLSISEVAQEIHLDVNEEGLEGAAATYADIATGMPENFFHMILDHPFQYAIMERTTGSIIFLGAVNKLDGPDCVTGIGAATPSSSYIYDLQGRRQQKNAHGIIIENGKKIIR